MMGTIDEAMDERVDKHVRDAARDWHARMHAGDVDAATRAAFNAWLHAHRDHKRAYRAYEQLYRDLDFALPEAGIDLDAMLGRKPSRITSVWQKLWSPPVWAGGLAAAAAALAFVVLALPGLVTEEAAEPVLAERPVYATEIAEISEITLEDGSIITLGARSRIETEFTETVRRVDLLEGEAFFDVATDEGRPFFVAAEDTLVRVVGTQFDVKSAGAGVQVSVLEGVVEVIRPEIIPDKLDVAPQIDSAPRQTLTAGERITALKTVTSLPPAALLEQSEAGAWRTGRLAYEDASLTEIISDLNRYHQRQIGISEDAIGDLRLTVTFRTTDLDSFLQMVEAIHPVEIDTRRADRITLRPREP